MRVAGTMFDHHLAPARFKLCLVRLAKGMIEIFLEGCKMTATNTQLVTELLHDVPDTETMLGVGKSGLDSLGHPWVLVCQNRTRMNTVASLQELCKEPVKGLTSLISQQCTSKW